jgi:hypothetical protein
VEIMDGGGCKQWWRFILAVLLLNLSCQKVFPYIYCMVDYYNIFVD